MQVHLHIKELSRLEHPWYYCWEALGSTQSRIQRLEDCIRESCYFKHPWFLNSRPPARRSTLHQWLSVQTLPGSTWGVGGGQPPSWPPITPHLPANPGPLTRRVLSVAGAAQRPAVHRPEAPASPRAGIWQPSGWVHAGRDGQVSGSARPLWKQTVKR